MLEEGRTTAWVKALLEDTFRPDNLFSLTAIYLGMTADMVKDIKELSFGYNVDLSYDTSHRGILPFTVIRVSMVSQVRGDTMPTVYLHQSPHTSTRSNDHQCATNIISWLGESFAAICRILVTSGGRTLWQLCRGPEDCPTICP
jgi:hypothetical protein